MVVVINRTRKDSCENARVLLQLARQSRCSQAQQTPVVNWDNHGARYASMHTNSAK